MKSWKILLLAIGTLFTLSGCCWTDQSKTIKEVAEPMAKELEHFYAKEKRFPTQEEGNNILKKIKLKINKNILIADSRAINYYSIRITRENTYCSIYLHDSGKVDEISCTQNPCLDIGQ